MSFILFVLFSIGTSQAHLEQMEVDALPPAEITMMDDGQSEPISPVVPSAVEPSIEELPVGNVCVVDRHAPITYNIVDDGTKRRKAKLMDSIGFTYNVHSQRSYATYWQCTVRPKGNPCKASVIERDGVYQVGKTVHNHQVEVGAFTAAKIMATVKTKALEDKFRPASAIVQEVNTFRI